MDDLEKRVARLEEQMRILLKDRRAGSKIEVMDEWVLAYLSEYGSTDASVLEEAAYEAGFGKQLLARSKQRLQRAEKIMMTRMGKRWIWAIWVPEPEYKPYTKRGRPANVWKEKFRKYKNEPIFPEYKKAAQVFLKGLCPEDGEEIMKKAHERKIPDGAVFHIAAKLVRVDSDGVWHIKGTK